MDNRFNQGIFFFRIDVLLVFLFRNEILFVSFFFKKKNNKNKKAANESNKQTNKHKNPFLTLVIFYAFNLI